MAVFAALFPALHSAAEDLPPAVREIPQDRLRHFAAGAAGGAGRYFSGLSGSFDITR